MTVLAAACAALAVLLAHRPGRPRAPIARRPRPPSDVRRQRGVAAALAVVAGLTWGRDLLGPLLGPAVGLAGAVLVWTAAGRGESSAERRATVRARAVYTDGLEHLAGTR